MPFAETIPVLMYHHVTAEGGSLAVSAAHFDRQIKGLAEAGYRSIRAADYEAYLAGRKLPAKSVLITFDDGYLDNWVYAHPVLQRYGFSAMLFAVTGLIGHGKPRAHAGQHTSLPECPPHQQAKQLMFSDTPDSVMLRWSEIHEMLAANTFEVHSHTHTHTRWDKTCNNPTDKSERLAHDLEQSKATLTSELGHASAHLCWPQGYFDDDYLDVAQSAGFKFLYTTDARGQNTPASNPLHIYRFAVRNRPAAWLKRRLWLASHPYWGPLYNRWKKASDDKKASRHRVS